MQRPHSGHTNHFFPPRSLSPIPSIAYAHFGHRFLPLARSHNNAHASTTTPTPPSAQPVHCQISKFKSVL